MATLWSSIETCASASEANGPDTIVYPSFSRLRTQHLPAPSLSDLIGAHGREYDALDLPQYVRIVNEV